MKLKFLFFLILSNHLLLSADDYSGCFSVGGSSSNYYPVLFSVSGIGGFSSLGKLSLYIPSVHTNGTYSGSFHSEIEFISSNWGHMGTKITNFTYIVGLGSLFNDPIGDIRDGSTQGSNSQLIIWLKGGASYSWSATNNSKVILTDGNSAGVAKTSTSGQPLGILNSQSSLVLKAKNNIYHEDVGMATEGNIYAGGKVGIGTTNPDQKLTVKGKIHAEEVIIDLNVPAADYVFAENYPLMPLHKVEKFIKANNHLPEIPSAAEVKEKGLSLGEMQNKLLQKIEELTLYVIEQDKSKKELEKKYNELLNKLESIKLTQQLNNISK